MNRAIPSLREATPTPTLRGIDFIDVEEVFEGDTVTVKDDRFNYGEEGFITFGLIEGRVIAVVHTEQDNLIRIISARKSTKNEEIRYFQQIAD
ncbi:BrnT family toxin [Nostoc sp. KVJ3]|uniref:BrnT family toxin n=1 Tax=Nostoc sp. KVJ3 TaxID=457945 RepID=UPI0022371662|nr:BrnT family toxin [Nostoc sp. KVJ3]MCW5317326.1 BrnT family toxin [Nostoc sp. KVJ3]